MNTEKPTAGNADYHFFLSFNGVDHALAARVRDVLNGEGYKVFFSDETIHVGDRFIDVLEAALPRSERVLALWTRNYRATDWSAREYNVGLSQNKLLILVCDGAELTPFASLEVHQSLRSDGDDDEFCRSVLALADRRQVRVTHKSFGRHFSDAEGFGRRDILEGPDISAFRFIGRRHELSIFDDAWNSKGARRVVCVVADGGYGKTTVAQKWVADHLDELRADVYAYSFYNQALESRESLDSTAFLDDAYKFFFAVGPDGVPSKNEVKLKSLLSRLKERPCVLILDGLEPMQVQRDGREFGIIRDDYLRRFILEFAQSNLPGLLIITSRLPVTDLGTVAMGDRNPVAHCSLPPLSESESVELLGGLGVHLSEPEARRLAATLDHQPLLLTVYGTEAARRGVTSLDRFDKYKEILKDKQAKVSDKITRFVLRTLPDLTPGEKSLLFSISLFDAPPNSRQLGYLLETGRVDHVTDGLIEKPGGYFRHNQFQSSLKTAEDGLEARRLLRVENIRSTTTVGSVKSYQMHALVHGGAREILKHQHLREYKEANWLIFRSMTKSVRPHFPDARQDLITLYQSVPFGVRSGRGKTAGWMYATRCLRGFRAYSTNKHGMLPLDIETLSHFFDGDWHDVKQDIGLTISDQTQALVWSGSLNCAVNQYRIGRPLLERGIQMAEDDQNYVTAARSARNLGYMCALHGELEEGRRFLEASIGFASKKPKLKYKLIELSYGVIVNARFQLMASHVTLGYLLYHLGRNDDAEASFRAGEQVHASECRRYPELRMVYCQRFCEFLTDTGRAQEAFDRANRGLRDPEKPRGWGEGALAAPVVTLALVKAATRLHEQGVSTLGLDALIELLDVAEGQVAGGDDTSEKDRSKASAAKERGGKMTWFRPNFRLARATLLRHQRRFDEAGLELDKARRECDEMGTTLLVPDIHLERARISLETLGPSAACRELRLATDCADQIGLRSRDNDFSDLRSQIRA